MKHVAISRSNSVQLILLFLFKAPSAFSFSYCTERIGARESVGENSFIMLQHQELKQKILRIYTKWHTRDTKVKGPYSQGIEVLVEWTDK